MQHFNGLTPPKLMELRGVLTRNISPTAAALAKLLELLVERKLITLDEASEICGIAPGVLGWPDQ